ncbi:MAG: succinylglutamate desuccinylase, partial [Geminicoccaceae bacterium]
GQHWARQSVEVAIATCRRFLEALEVVEPAMLARLCPPPEPAPQRTVEVTDAVTVNGGPFRFTQDFQGLEIVPEAGTIIAYDGTTPIRTPYDQCILIMPSRRLVPGLTAVRLGQFVD